MRLRAVFAALVAMALILGGAAPLLADPTIKTMDHPLADPAMEAKARAMMREIRCVVCQTQSIDESDADIAADLRNIVREQLAAGKSETEIRAYLTARYGDFVLLDPPFKPETLVLWIGPFALAAIALGAGFAFLRHHRGRTAPAAELSAAERARLQALLVEGESSHRHAGGGA
jgi:cytochrome c-type biogenesis protein CcmH